MQEPVKCSAGHVNDPYPSSGMCVVCNNYLPGNEAASSTRGKNLIFTKDQKDVAKRLLEGEGIKWPSAPETLRQLALGYAKTGQLRALEMMMGQIGTLRARPKPGEEVREEIYNIHLTSNTVENLHRSLHDLNELLK